MDALFFWPLSFLMLAGALAVVLSRNPVASALSLAFSIVMLAGLFLCLHAYFLAAIQVIVYAGAVMVLFLFIIMLLDLKAEEMRRIRWFGLVGGAAVGLFFAWQFRRVLLANPAGHVTAASLPPAPANEIPALGALLFGKYVLPFEVVGVLLLVAMLGVVVLSKKELK
jgi:NADH-quinone oxidoreductase subunit J